MESKNLTEIPVEVKLTAELLLDTEKKIEILQSEINKSHFRKGQGLGYNPPGYSSTHQGLDNRTTHLNAQIVDLTNRTLTIARLIEKASSSENQKRVHRLIEEWKTDIQVIKQSEDKQISTTQKKFNRMLNKDWDAIGKVPSIMTNNPPNIEVQFLANREDIDGRIPSYLEQARGLKRDFAYLEKEEKGQSEPEIDIPEPDGAED